MAAFSAPVYCPNCGASLRLAEAAGPGRPVCPDCGFVYYHNPIPAVGMLIEMDGGLVLIQRAAAPDAGAWALPSGVIEADARGEAAAIREAREETGLESALREMVGVFSFPDGPPTSGIIVFYRARPIGGSLRAGDDAQDARVFTAADMPEVPFRTHRQALARWRYRLGARPGTGLLVERDGFYIREADPAEMERVLELAALIPGKIAPEDPDLPRAAAQRMRESLSLQVFVAVTTGEPAQVIGFVGLSRVATLTASLGWIDAMVVDPAFRRNGVGAALLEASLRHADKLGMAEIFVNTDNASDLARAFYQSSGFREGKITPLRLR